jgi:arylsulfatase A-like enzyme
MKYNFTLLTILLLAPLAALSAADIGAKPNVIVILTDDFGYDDVGCYWTPDNRPGFEKIRTPNLDRLAAEGARFTDFYSPAPVCTPSRAALMTGCYPVRVGMSSFGRNGGVVLSEAHLEGLNPDEVTLAEILKKRGYATACVGKWHLGHLAPFTPRQHGFDAFYGMMFPNDMQPFVLHRDETVVEPKPDQKTLNERFTEEAVKFVRAKREEPFFLYLSYSAPHIPLHLPDRLRGKSARGLYGDVVEHLDSGVGEVLKALDETGLADQTLIVFTSDNGPDTRGPYDKRGQAFPLRAAKATTREGGVRVPCIMRWPGRIPAGLVCREIASAMDVLPTVAGIAGAQPPQDRIIDGKDILPLITKPGAPSPHDAFFYYYGEKLEAVRSANWKLVFPRTAMDDTPYERKPGAAKEALLPEALYDLAADVGETTDVIGQHPEVAQRLRALAERMRDDIGDSATNQKGKNRRPVGRVPASGQ